MLRECEYLVKKAGENEMKNKCHRLAMAYNTTILIG